MKFSDQLLEDIRLQKSHIPFEFERDGVIKNLEFLYHACVASEGLLQEAGETAFDISSSEFYRRLAGYYHSHLEEEKGEIAILKEDLATVGVEPGLPDAASVAMVGSQYYYLKHINPVCLLGYMAVQEADPSKLELVEQLEQLFGKELFRFLRMHAIKDVEHGKELIELLDEVPPEFHRLIRHSAINALGYLRKAATEFYETLSPTYA
jgi:hypothetical protein